jgi:hypothetical protein
MINVDSYYDIWFDYLDFLAKAEDEEDFELKM